MISRPLLILPGFALLAVLVKAAPPQDIVENLTPAKALEAFELEDGFAVDLVAAEPLVIDPVALAFDETGRLYVAEDRDYPVLASGAAAQGRIALLTDRDGDGVMDGRSEFAEDIAFPMGVMPWRGGVIVCASPDVLWMKDYDGDGKADVREVLLTGFAPGGSTQLRVNDPTLAPDGWVYLAGGLSGGVIHSPLHPDKKVDTARSDVRFRPDTGEIEPVSGKSQYGIAFDDAGNRFACMNRVPVQHAPLPLEAMNRHAFTFAPGALQNCSELISNTLMTHSSNSGARLFPISTNITTADSHAGTYSAACGVHVYRGAALPLAYQGAVFTCDPTANLVRGDRLVESGGTFSAVRIHDGTEALRTRDNWFRPVFIADGPDGALYIADMYRKVIEHPAYVPEAARARMDWQSGRDKGRIWRLRSKEHPATAKFDSPSLTNDVPWARDTAFRLLRENGNGPAALKEASLLPRTAAWALSLLSERGQLTDDLLSAALRHPHPDVCTSALRLAGECIARPEIARLVSLCARRSDSHVRYHAALALAHAPAADKLPLLAHIAAVQGRDAWTRSAIHSALAGPEEAAAFLKSAALLTDPLPQEMLEPLGRRLAGENALGLTESMQALPAAWKEGRAAFLTGFLEASGKSVSEEATHWLRELALSPSSVKELPPESKLRAVRLLAFDGSPEVTALMESLAISADAAAVAAASALLHPARGAAASRLLTRERWPALTPGVRAVLLPAMAGRAEFTEPLLGAVEAGILPRGLIPPPQRELIIKMAGAAQKERAEKLLGAAVGSRRAAYEEAKAALDLKPAAASGRAVFLRSCAACHRLGREGVAVGPDLFDIRNQPKETILLHIVIPDYEIAPNFTACLCVTKDGRQITGLLATESTGSITLRMPQGVEEQIPRGQIASLTTAATSLMPAELEKTMTRQELADLIEWLRGGE